MIVSNSLSRSVEWRDRITFLVVGQITSYQCGLSRIG